jgi:hypothetical protein
MNDLNPAPQQKKKMSDVEFLLSIAGLGASDEDDVSERNKEILASEVGAIRGWHVDNRDRNRASSASR